jgi:chaperone modulatory protein CbpM
MTKNELLIISDYAKETFISLTEVSEICGVSIRIINELINHDIISIDATIADQAVISVTQLHRVQVALRLQRDLDVNFAGIAVILDLVDKVHVLQDEVDLLKKCLRCL